MPTTCCIVGCRNRHDAISDIRYFCIPRGEHQRLAFIRAINRPADWIPKESSRVCSEHFELGVISKNSSDPDYVPHIFKCKEKRNRRMPLSGGILQPTVELIEKPSTSGSSIYKPGSILPLNVGASTASTSTSQEPLSVVNPQETIVKQHTSPGLPQITEISWGSAVARLPTDDGSWITDSILPTPAEICRPQTRDIGLTCQPRTRDIGVQVEVISTRMKNVIVKKTFRASLQPSQNSRQLGRTSACSNSQYDLVSVVDVPDFPPPLAPIQSQCASNKEPAKQQNVSATSGKTERVFLVFEAMLLQLFTFCRLCFAGCSASVSSSCISVVIVQTNCDNGHKLEWESRPPRKSLGFVQLLQKEVNRLRKELSECHPSEQPTTNVKKKLKAEAEFIDVLKLLSLPEPLTCSSHSRDDRCVDS